MEIHAFLFFPVLLTILIYKFCGNFLVISHVSYLNHLSVSSHKKQKDSLETRAIYINLVSLWYIKNYRTTKSTGNQNMESSEGDQLLAGASHAIMDEIEADILAIAKKWN